MNLPLEKTGGYISFRLANHNLLYVHSFSQVSIHTGDKGNTNKFATVGVDGRFVIWDVKVSVL
jgi:hypothetical protein